MKSKKKPIANVAKKVAENALRRDANRTSCLAFYQPKAPAEQQHLVFQEKGC